MPTNPEESSVTSSAVHQPDELAQRFAALFHGRTSGHGLLWPPPALGAKKPAWAGFKAVTSALYAKHLAGAGLLATLEPREQEGVLRRIMETHPDYAELREPSLGLVPVTEKNTCYFAALDIDVKDWPSRAPLTDAELTALAVKAAELHLPLIVCRSSSGGAHLYRFFRSPVTAAVAIARLRMAKAALGLPAKTEIFPKQSKISEDGLGNWIGLPYFGGDATQRCAIGKDGQRLSLLGFIEAAEAARAVEDGDVMDGSDPFAGGFADGPPCMQQVHAEGVPAGVRNDMVFNAAVYGRKLHRSDWKEQAKHYNGTHLAAPLSPQEVKGILRSANAKNYSFRCVNGDRVCTSPEACGLIKKLVGGVKLANLTKYDTDPPSWSVEVEGELLRLGSTDDLLNQGKVRVLLVSQRNRMLPRFKQNEWDDLVKDLLSNVKVIEAPPDVGQQGRFAEIVLDYLASYAKHDGLEGLLLGAAVRDPEAPERLVFRTSDLEARLRGRNWYVGKEGGSDVYNRLRAMGATPGEQTRKVSGRSIRVWYVPFAVMDGQEQTEPFTYPPAKNGRAY